MNASMQFAVGWWHRGHAAPWNEWMHQLWWKPIMGTWDMNEWYVCVPSVSFQVPSGFGRASRRFFPTLKHSHCSFTHSFSWTVQAETNPIDLVLIVAVAKHRSINLLLQVSKLGIDVSMEYSNGEPTLSDLATLVIVIVVMLSFGETFIECAYRYRQTEKSFQKVIMKIILILNIMRFFKYFRKYLL